MTDEPSVLDFVKSLLTPWRGKPIPIPPAERKVEAQLSPEDRPAPIEDAQAMDSGLTPVQVIPDTPQVEARTVSMEIPQTIPSGVIEVVSEATPTPATTSLSAALPWRGLVALGLALMAQLALEPRTNRDWLFGALLYGLAVVWLIYSARKGDWQAAVLPEAETRTPEPIKLRIVAFLVSLPLIMLAFLAFGDNRFTSLNLALWILAFICLIWSLWQGFPSLSDIWQGFRAGLRLPRNVTISGWTLLVLACVLMVIFLRVYRMNEVPPEMVSDQAEKLLDVNDVLNGQWSIFFPRNTGREPFQFYLTGAISQLFDTGISFTSLKIGTILLGLITLPYIYLLGKEVGNQRAGLFAATFAGISYWGNVVSRIGLRFALYPVFVAPTLYYLI
jgi:hypothetical protein